MYKILALIYKVKNEMLSKLWIFAFESTLNWSCAYTSNVRAHNTSNYIALYISSAVCQFISCFICFCVWIYNYSLLRKFKLFCNEIYFLTVFSMRIISGLILTLSSWNIEINDVFKYFRSEFIQKNNTRS